MTKRAEFQGEFHTSRSDWEALQKLLENDVDAVFIEGRKPRIRPQRWSIGYIAFLIGVRLLYLFQELTSDVPSEPEYDVPDHDEIDLTIPEVYHAVSLKWKLIGAFSVSLLVLCSLFFALVPFLNLHTLPVHLIVGSLLIAAFLLGAAIFLFSVFIILVEEVKVGERDRRMCERITSISDKNDYESIVISCGDMHLNRLPDLLEENGWETNGNRSSHGFAAKLYGIPMRWADSP